MRLSLRVLLFISLISLIPIGLGTKFYHGPGDVWVQQYAGDIFYPMFWFVLAMLIFPRLSPLLLSLLVFLLTTTIEFTQLLNGPILIRLRQSFFGRTLVGNSFGWMDIFYYLIGCLLAIFLYYGVAATSRNQNIKSKSPPAKSPH